MNKTTQTQIIKLIHQEVIPAIGCTEPVAVALAAAKAAEVLGCRPEKTEVFLSANILKNAMGVGIPGTGMVGLPIAIALGTLIGKSAYGLEVLRDLTPEALTGGKQMIEDKCIHIALKENVDKLYIEVLCSAGDETSRVIICHEHTNIVYVEKNGSWTKSGDAAYDASANAYVTELTSFSNHSFGPSYTAASKGSSSEDLGEVTIDNLGNMSAKDGEIKAKQKMGWTIDGDLSALLKAQFPALTSADIESLVASINSAIASTKGASAGISESTVSMGTAKVSGDTKMTVKLSASVRQTTGTFNFMYQGKPVSFSVPVKTYSGVATQITYQYGSSHTDHSGGTGK